MPVKERSNFDYSKLYGRMRELGITQNKLAASIGITEAALNNKLTGKSYFGTPEIFGIADELDIPDDQFKVYFFTLKVQKS